MTILDCDDVLPARQNGDFDMTEGSLIRHDRLVRIWLLAVAALIFAMVLVGGATRLTESGLSITEWKPVTGVVPPLSRQRMAGRVREIPGDPAIPASSTAA